MRYSFRAVQRAGRWWGQYRLWRGDEPSGEWREVSDGGHERRGLAERAAETTAREECE